MRVLVIAPHPDDEVLGCGGTIAKHAAAGDDVHVCVVTKGYAPECTEDDLARRRQEVFAVNRILGIERTHFLELPTVRLDTVPQNTLNTLLSQVTLEANPQVLYVPHRGDVNKDHRLVFDAAIVATRPKPGSRIQRVLCYETLSSTEWAAPFAETAFTPNVYVDISRMLEIKLKAMSAYQLELKEYPHPRSLDGIAALAKRRGATVGVQAAEAFVLVREIV